ncbi:MAG: MFS transporter [Alphaproteobacteria bacterium]|nr:MFS transporter [Alphaproteobacteria bacterium]
MPEAEEEKQDQSWRSLWLSSGALSLALLGDSLIYVVLPVNAEAFGVSLFWVGILLAANRVIRTFTYGFVAHFGQRVGLRNLCIIACITSVLSTVSYGVFQGWAPLLGGRLLWGLSYAALLLVTLGYAASDRAKTGTRVGSSRAVTQLGPVLALTGGAWLAGVVGPQDVFLVCGLLSLVALPMAFMLPVRLEGAAKPPASRPAMLPKPDRLDMLIFWIGVGADGIFVMTMTIMLARQTSLEVAMISGGALLAGRHIAGIVAAPLAGIIADRVGVRAPLVAMAVLLIAGLLMIGLGWFAFGASAIIVSRGALAALFPAAVAYFSTSGVLQPLARNQTWRDVGAAVGPIGAGLLIGVVTPEVMHLVLAAICAVTLLLLMTSSTWRRREG